MLLPPGGNRRTPKMALYRNQCTKEITKSQGKLVQWGSFRIRRDSQGIIHSLLVGIFYGSPKPAHNVEDPVGFRDYLFCVGIHLSCNSRRRPRSSAVSPGG